MVQELFGSRSEGLRWRHGRFESGSGVVQERVRNSAGVVGEWLAGCPRANLVARAGSKVVQA